MWKERYDHPDYLFGTEPAEGLIRTFPHLHVGGRTLVLADGEGRNSVYLAEQGMDVVAMDYVEVALEKARKLAVLKQVNVEFRQSDILSWNWNEEAYDNVVGVFIQFTPPDERELVFKGIKDGLRSGGRVLLHGYTPKQVDYRTGGPPDPTYMYTEELLKDAFREFNILYCNAYEADISEGAGHRGQSALIDFVAEKP